MSESADIAHNRSAGPAESADSLSLDDVIKTADLKAFSHSSLTESD